MPRVRAERDSILWWLGTISFVAFAVHAANHVHRGETHDLLWICNVAPLLLAFGCWLGRPLLAAVPALWLTFGTPMWLTDLFTGGELVVTSFFPHVLGPLLAVLAVRRLGWPRRAWLAATLGMVGLMLAARLTTPPSANVNLAFEVWNGWERWFPRYELYFVVILAGSTLTFLVMERLFCRIGRTRAKSEGV